MRDYPSVPNVFRVASSHSVDTDPVTVVGGSDNGDIKTTNANFTAGQLQQYPQKHQQLQNGNISGHQQPPLVKSTHHGSSTAIITASTSTVSNHATNSAAATTTKSTLSTSASLSTSSASLLKTFAANKANDESQQRQQQYKHTAHASIEKPSNSSLVGSSQLYLHSPYATLPRNPINISQSSLSLHSFAANGGDIYAGQQQHHQQHNNSLNSSNKQNSIGNSNTIIATTSTTTVGNNNQSSPPVTTNENKMMGVINTISGSIPSTGFPPIDHGNPNTNTINASGGLTHMGVNGRTMSVASDLNTSMNNSCTNLSKLNGFSQHQQLQQQQRHLQQQKLLQHPSTTAQQRDFRQVSAAPPPIISHLDEFTPYRRSMVPPCTTAMERNTGGYLWIITPVAASISVAIVIAALAGPQWLFTEEKQPNTNYNGTANFNVLDDGAFITRYTKSSLWIICSTVQGVETYNCVKIDYFSKEGYQPDPHDSASAIPYTVTKSCPFFLASGIVLLLSFIVFLIPTCSHQNNLYYFSAGIMFIVSGLLMLIGLIAYISILKAEIGSKLRPRSSLQPPMFKVTYGQSFFLFVFGFIATEFVGLLNIFLYISLQEAGYYSRLPCFSISNLQEKIREGENRQKRQKQKSNKNTYKSYKHELDKKPIDRKRHAQQNKKRQVRAQELELDSKKLLKNMTQMGRIEAVAAVAATGRRAMTDMLDRRADAPSLACRKHPNGLGSTMFLNELERRYYFEKNSDQAPAGAMSNKCNLHSKNLAKSLNELYLESTLPPPPPSAIRMGAGAGFQLQQQRQRHQNQHRSQYQLQIQTLPRPPQQFSDTPQEFPLTRSVSTTTEIYATHNVSFAGDLSEKATTASNNKTSLQEQKNSGGGGGSSSSNRRRSVATNTRFTNSDTEAQANVALGTESSGNQQQQQKQHDNKKNLHNKRQQHQQQQYGGKISYKFDEQQQQQQHQRAGHHTVHRNNGNVDVENDDVDHNNDDDDEDPANEENDNDDADEEEQPQKLCGLKRGIRKTKDELFEEFCKRAGVRPKPKNIYYIENDEEEEDDTAGLAEDDTSHRRDMNAVTGSGGMNHKIFRSKNNIRNSNTTMANQNPLDGRRKLHDRLSEYRAGANDSGSSSRSGKTRENNHIFMTGEAAEGDMVVVDDDAADDDDTDGMLGVHAEDENDEHGFKKLTENEDHLYVIDDNIHLLPPSSAALHNNGRRASMYVEPNHMRRLNSNLSLHALYTPLPMPKALYDFESSHGVAANNDYAGSAFPLTHGNATAAHHFMTRDVYGGSQNRLHHHPDYQQQQLMYQSRTTLPRALVKRSTDSQDSIASALSTSQLHNIYSSSQQRLTNLMMQHQQQQQQHLQQQQQLQQLQPQHRYLSLSREQDVYSSRYGLHKSNEELNGHFVQQQQQQQSMYLQPPHQIQYTQQHPHAPLSSSLKQQPPQQQPVVQWPTAIPSSPSNFRLYNMGAGGVGSGPTATVVSSQNSNHAVLTRSQSGGGNGTAGGHGPSKFQRAYAFDEQRRPSVMVAASGGDAFDLDEIERERRRSHASLYAGMGIVNGSPTVKTNGGIGTGSTGIGMGQQLQAKSTGHHRDHYDMINGTAV
ncbi:stargazin-like protein [Musca autumnalis]|uniref:stargazin-like protein n=1 Tax=Musca autumnalis TaxID=221902 RepID=UPI003CEC9DF1